MGTTAGFCLVLLGCAFLMGVTGSILTGMYVGWGPFRFLQFDKQEKEILKK